MSGAPSQAASASGGTGTVAPPRPPPPDRPTDASLTTHPNNSPSMLPSNPRRRTLIGRNERDVDLMMYAEGWRQRIEMNAPFDQVKAAKAKGYVDPVVTVALRSDGSLESVTFNRSSGVPELDEVIKKIVQQFAPYSEFPADLAREYDIIEIRRVWTLDVAIRLFAGGR